MLKSFKSSKPIPPFSFGKHILSQLIHASFFSSFTCPHQNCLTIPVNLSHRVLGSLKQLIVYDGIAWATAFIIISFLAFESNFSFHLASLFNTRYFNWENRFLLDLPTKEGSPRSDPCGFMTCTPNIILIVSLTPMAVLWLKNKEVLFLFNCWPKDASYTYNILWISSHSLTMAFPNIRLLLAKNKCEILGPLADDVATPLSSFLWTALCSSADKPSAQIRNK